MAPGLPNSDQYKIPAPIDEFFKENSYRGKALITLDAIILTALLGQKVSGQSDNGALIDILILLLAVALFSLCSALVVQNAHPKLAVVLVVLGVFCFVFGFLFAVAAVLSPHLRSVVWVVGVFMAALLVLLFTDGKP